MDAEIEALRHRAVSLREAGRVAEAIAAYEQLLEREPDLPDSWYNLGWLQRHARQYERALASYGEALKRGVRGPEEVHLNRAVILADHLARPAEAEAELNAALAVKPDYVPALLNLGNLHEDRGKREPAESAYRRVLDADPANSIALSRRAGLFHARELDRELAERLRAALRQPKISPGDQAQLGFALAGLLDAAGHFDEAFAAAAAANAASRAATGSRYDRAAAERFIDTLISSFDSPAPGEPAEAPIYIVGMFRSGSTLVEQILGGHNEIEGGGELESLPQLVRRIPGYPQSVKMADSSAVRAWRNFYLEGLAPIARKGLRVTDKRPDNFLHVGLIKTLFPAAKIVHTRRDRLDNLLSLYFLHLGPDMPYALDLEDAAHWYAQYERLMAHWKALYPDDIFDVDYDRLVQTPEPIMRSLLGFLELDWTPAMLDFHNSDRPVKTASVWQVRQPLHSRSSGRWRNYERWLTSVVG